MTLTIATILAGLVAGFSPLVLRYIHLDGLQMMALTMAVSVLVVATAGLISGDLNFDRASLITVLTGSASFWAIQQVVYKTLKETRPSLVMDPMK